MRRVLLVLLLGTVVAACSFRGTDGSGGINLYNNNSRPVCGNALVEGEEECDEGTGNSDTIIDSCRTNCTFAHCGDGVIDTGEMCDDRNNVGGDGCSADCLSNERCGNGIPDQGTWEKCDDGNDVDWDGCRRCEISEFRVSSMTAGQQMSPSTAVSSDGSLVVVWASGSQDGYGFGVFGQRYDTAGTPVGTEFQVNTETSFNEEEPAVAMTPDGRFVVVWQSGGTDHQYDVHGQRYDPMGERDGEWFVVNTYTSGDQITPAVAMAPDGSFVAVWVGVERDGSEEGIFGQRFDSFGDSAGAEFQINVYTQGSQYWPEVATAADGRFVVVWASVGQDGSQEGVFGRVYDSSGNPAGGEFQVNTYTEREQEWPAVAMTPDGTFIVAWSSRGQDGDHDVYGQRFDAQGNHVGSEFIVNTHISDRQCLPSVSAASDGRFVVLWDSDGQGGQYWDVFGQRFDPSGVPVGPEFRVNQYTEDHQWFVSVSMTPDGNFVAAWESRFQDEESLGIYGQRYTADGEARGILPW